MTYFIQGTLTRQKKCLPSLENYCVCDEERIRIEQTIFTPLKSNWEEYLTKWFGETKDKKTISGELFLWDEKRTPFPFLYSRADGKLEDSFVFEDGKFVQGPKKVGTRLVTGLSLDTPLLNLCARKSEVRMYL
jgi:hypothetical protein